MAYILRTHIKKKYLVHGLESVYGIGCFLSKRICQSLGFQKSFQLKNITNEQIFHLSQSVDEWNYPLKGELQRIIKQRIDKLATLKTFRGIRHRQGLPVRGQRTHTNAKTQKKLKYLKKS
jgi:small subunit ribosomal protein S13